MNKKLALLMIGALMSTPLFAACSSQATNSAFCAYTQGNGTGGADALVHKVYFPGEQFTVGASETAYYFPCNARNLTLAPNSADKDANGNAISSVIARTKTNTEVEVQIVMYWELNQDRDVLKDVFVPLCDKYKCASTDASKRDAASNTATAGWTTMLGENFVRTLQVSTTDTINSWSDEAWQDKASQKPKIATAISDAFMSNMHAPAGSSKNLLCGSGESSSWSDPTKPGQGTFTCGSVRVVVLDVQPTNKELLNIAAKKAQADAEAAANVAILEAAKKKYGTKAEEALADQDLVQKCKDTGMTICSAGGVTVGVSAK